ncbi:MAG: TerB family tellurite resistance protein [Spirochaetales bacterium]|nr:TerB family tellurite resistance protein [Spirochaetales bacterium]
MPWFGKIVGGTLGLILGGPLGAVAGMAFGHLSDKMREASGTGQQSFYSRSYDQRLNYTQRANMTFFVGCFSMLAKLTQADGGVSQAEVRSVEDFMTEDLRLDPLSRNSAVQIFNSAQGSPESFGSFAAQFYDQFRGNPQVLDLMIDILVRVAAADGGVSRAEENLILEAVRIFRFSETKYETIKSRYGVVSNRNYAVLEVSPTASNEEIKKAYRRLVSEYHPDKIASKGVPEEFMKYASDKFREIQAAYEAVRKERGF